jgi:hypothetical protein
MGSLRKLIHRPDILRRHIDSLRYEQIAEVIESGLDEDFPDIWLDIQVCSDPDRVLVDWDFPITPGYTEHEMDMFIRAILKRSFYLLRKDVKTLYSRNGIYVEIVRGA